MPGGPCRGWAGWAGRQEQGEGLAFTGLSQEEEAGQGDILGLAGWNNSVALSTWMTKAEEYCCWAVRARQRRAGSGLVSLHVKGRLLAGLCCPQELAGSEGGLSPARGFVNMSKQRNT